MAREALEKEAKATHTSVSYLQAKKNFIDKQNELKQANSDLRETQAKLRAAVGSREESEIKKELAEA